MAHDGVSFTQREIEVVWLLEARLSHEEIAAALHISSEAVERHASSVHQKLMAHRVLPSHTPYERCRPGAATAGARQSIQVQADGVDRLDDAVVQLSGDAVALLDQS